MPAGRIKVILILLLLMMYLGLSTFWLSANQGICARALDSRLLLCQWQWGSLTLYEHTEDSHRTPQQRSILTRGVPHHHKQAAHSKQQPLSAYFSKSHILLLLLLLFSNKHSRRTSKVVVAWLIVLLFRFFCTSNWQSMHARPRDPVAYYNTVAAVTPITP